MIDEAGSDEVYRTWRRSDSGVCYAHADGNAEVTAGAWIHVALGEKCSVLRVLVELLAPGPLT